MALTITITDPKLIELIQQKAKEAGVSQSEAAQRVLEERSDVAPAPEPKAHTMTQQERDERAEKAMKILSRIHAQITDEDRAFDYDAWLYDENGLPH